MGIDAGAIRELTEALDGKRPAQQPTVARARVVQADGGGTWVQLDGGAARTPVASSTVAVMQGDEVMVRIDGGNAVVTGNISRPSTDDSALDALERTMDTFTRRVSDLNGNVSEIRQSADSIATRVENVEGSVASMEHTAEGWSWVTSVKNQAIAASTAAEKAATDAANAQSSADEAAKTATDYMSFAGGVLDVGAKDASGNMKGHTSIKNNGFSVVDQNGLVLLDLTAWSDAGGKYTVLDMAHDSSGYKATMQSDAYEGEGARVMFGMRAPDGSVYGLMVYGDVGSQIIGGLEVTGSITSGDMCYVSHGKASTDAMTKTTRTDTGRSVAFGVGAGGTNAGVYDNNKGKWLLHADNDNTYLNGACVDVTSSTTASDFFAPYSTNVTSVNSGQVSMWGKICQVHVSVKMKTAISAGNISNTKIGTLKSGYRPKTIAALTSGTAGPVCSFHVEADGSVYVDATHSAVSAGDSISFGGTFILA